MMNLAVVILNGKIYSYLLCCGVMFIYRCECGNCQSMPTSIECTCCREIDAIESKMLENPTDIHCIIDHEGFQGVCLDVWVLQTAYHNYRQKYGDAEEKSVHE